MKVTIEVWFCKRCWNYYGSSSAGNLGAQWNHDEKNRPTFPRSRCPNHLDQPVLRKPYVFEIEIPDESESNDQ